MFVYDMIVHLLIRLINVSRVFFRINSNRVHALLIKLFRLIKFAPINNRRKGINNKSAIRRSQDNEVTKSSFGFLCVSLGELKNK